MLIALMSVIKHKERDCVCVWACLLNYGKKLSE